jgi:hypothetical protein
MATPKEQHDARSNARNIGHQHRRVPPADATPPGGVPTVAIPRGDAPPSEEDAARIRDPRVRESEARPRIGDPPR